MSIAAFILLTAAFCYFLVSNDNRRVARITDLEQELGTARSHITTLRMELSRKNSKK